jgi:hypothetical protein
MDDLGADDPAADLGMYWHDHEQCTFSREEGEVYGTYVGSAMSRNEGDDMLKWACNRARRIDKDVCGSTTYGPCHLK